MSILFTTGRGVARRQLNRMMTSYPVTTRLMRGALIVGVEPKRREREESSQKLSCLLLIVPITKQQKRRYFVLSKVGNGRHHYIHPVGD